MAEPDRFPRRDPAWNRLSEQSRHFTVDAVRALCAHLAEPQHRPIAQVPNPRPAATVVPVIDVDGEAGVIITKRPSTMTYHRGDWVFPGGRVDVGIDASPADAARREAQEELGIPREDVEIIGQLDSHGPIVTGFTIDVFVALVADGATLSPDPREVGELLVVPLAWFMNDASYEVGRPWPDHEPGPPAPGASLRDRSVSEGGTSAHQRMTSFALPNGDLVWGTQGEILANFLDELASLRERGIG